MNTVLRASTRLAAWLSLTAGAVAGQQPSPNAARANPAPGDSVRWARVTYLAGRSVYVSAGRDDGLREGTQLDVVRRGATIAVMRTTVVSSHRASCEVIQNADSVVIAVDDSVRFIAQPGPAGRVTAADSATAPNAVEPAHVAGGTLPATGHAVSDARQSLRALGLRGRVGLRYLIVAQRDSGAVRFTQPAADVRVDGQRIAGTPVGLSIDARGRRTYSTRGDTTGSEAASRTYVYQMTASFTTDAGARVAIGRQISESFANVSLYDGISAEVGRRRWGTGVFAGTQPAPATMGYSSDVREYGAYVQAHNAAGEPALWSMTVGGIGSYHASDPNREFAFAQLVLSTARASLYATQEVDYNRGWKVDAGEPTVQPTSTYMSAQLRPWDPFTVYAGFDSRRNVRLWRDLVSPETEFDDRFRQGVWAGASLRAGSHARFSADVRSSDGGDSSGTRTTAAGGSIALERLGTALLGAHVRSTRYRSPWLEGWLHSAAVSVSPRNGQLRLEAEGGLRDERDAPGVAVTGTPGRSQVRWIGLNGEVALGRSWYLLLTATRERGGWDSADQGYASLTWRF